MIEKIRNKGFVHPLNNINLVDVINYISTFHGVENSELRFKNQLEQHIPKHKHTIFVLLDGFGINLVKSLPENHILKDATRATINSLFPTTTAICLTSISTGKYPIDHGICGWWTYLKEFKLDITPLPFKDRFTRTALEEKNISVSDVFLHPSIFQKYISEVHGIFDRDIGGSTFSKYSIGNHPFVPYDELSDCTNSIIANINKAKGNSFQYIYYSLIDHNAHVHGLNAGSVQGSILEASTFLENLKKIIPKDTLIIATADHGLLDIEKKNKFSMNDRDPLLKFLETPPTGEPRVPIFHVKKGFEKRFARSFNSRFKGKFLLLSKYELRKSKLIGEGKLQERFGDFIAIPLGPYIFSYQTKKYPQPPFIGYHGGLTESEMKIPLIVL